MASRYKRRSIKIVARIPIDETDNVIAAFICEALEIYGGQFHPSDPLFGSLSVESIQIGRAQIVNPKPKEMKDYEKEGLYYPHDQEKP